MGENMELVQNMEKLLFHILLFDELQTKAITGTLSDNLQSVSVFNAKISNCKMYRVLIEYEQ